MSLNLIFSETTSDILVSKISGVVIHLTFLTSEQINKAVIFLEVEVKLDYNALYLAISNKDSIEDVNQIIVLNLLSNIPSRFDLKPGINFSAKFDDTIGKAYREFATYIREELDKDKWLNIKIQHTFFTKAEQNLISYPDEWSSLISENTQMFLKDGIFIVKLPKCIITYSLNDKKITIVPTAIQVKVLDKIKIVRRNLDLYEHFLEAESLFKGKDILIKYQSGFFNEKEKFPQTLNVEIFIKMKNIGAWNELVSFIRQDKKHPTLAEIKRAYNKVLDTIKEKEDKKNKEEQKLLEQTGLLGSHLVRGILDIIIRNEQYIAKGMIITSLKGEINRSNTILSDSEQYSGQFSTVTKEIIENYLNRMVKAKILTERDIKGTYGYFTIYKPTESENIKKLVFTEYNRKKSCRSSDNPYNDDEFDNLLFAELPNEEKTKKEVSLDE